MPPLQVELVSEHASPLAVLGGADAGGQNVHVAALAMELGRLGARVTVSTRRDDPALPRRVELAPNVVVEHVDAGPPQPIPKDDLFGFMSAFARRLEQRWLARPPDVVHAHFWMSGWAAARAARDLPMALTFHALGVVKTRHQGAADTSPPQRQAVEAALADRADAVVATCYDEVRELVGQGVDTDRITVVPCGVDPTLFRPYGAVAPRGPGHRVLVIGRMVPRKGIEDCIRSLVDLPGTELVVAGGPADRAGLAADPEVRRLRTIAATCGLTERVRFLGGVPRDQVPPLIRSADVVVASPWYEPFGIVPLEAMACGVPVVGSTVGGLLDTVQHQRTGLLVPPRDPAALASAVGRLLAHPSLRERMGQVGAALVRDRFTWPQVARSTLDVYRRLARKNERWAVSA